jgi:hypothetical protein
MAVTWLRRRHKGFWVHIIGEDVILGSGSGGGAFEHLEVCDSYSRWTLSHDLILTPEYII